MLQIKDNIDLKELLKYGFEFNGSCYEYACKEKAIDQELTVEIFVSEYHEKYILIYVSNDDFWEEEQKEDEFYYDNLYYMPNIIFDLIQAGLVEKVEE